MTTPDSVTEAMKRDPAEIWLEPKCNENTSEGRCWHSHKPERCDDCDLEPVKYVRANLVPSPISPTPQAVEALREALEKIALLDEADGHELTVKHAHQAVAIATSTLGKHPSEILADRHVRPEEKPARHDDDTPVCDCQCPEPESGAALISETCLIHNHPHEARMNRRALGLPEDDEPARHDEGGSP